MKNVLLPLLIALSVEAMDITKVKIPSHEVLEQKFEKYCLDEFFSNKQLQPMYDLADQEKTPDEVISIINKTIQERNININQKKDAYAKQGIHFMQGKEIRRNTFK